MKNYFVFVFLAYCSILFGQTESYQITYNSNLNDAGNPKGGTEYIRGELFTNGENSIYIEHIKDTIVSLPDGDVFESKANNFPKPYVKDLKSKSIRYNARHFKGAIIDDKSIDFNWKLQDETLDILGYKCLSAKCTFRGRTFIAYYLPDLPINDGPFKFMGLPGIILKVVSEDKAVNIEAVSITMGVTIPKDPLIEKKEIISYQEAIKKFKAFVETVEQNAANEGDDGFKILSHYIECYN
ncbi:GLPGLI family protein [Flavobacterium sp.]|uniref:GLPGLI family protein n=1 Tax=Flavobacterium sp. TaxID=239 RepID=UPI002621A5B0|nr:GLPGLI family protein [Flavobacterium sp.]